MAKFNLDKLKNELRVNLNREFALGVDTMFRKVGHNFKGVDGKQYTAYYDYPLNFVYFDIKGMDVPVKRIEFYMAFEPDYVMFWGTDGSHEMWEFKNYRSTTQFMFAVVNYLTRRKII